ncbi:MAG: hypothetical protein ACRC1M_04925 [Methanobacteriaceae archaeon]
MERSKSFLILLVSLIVLVAVVSFVYINIDNNGNNHYPNVVEVDGAKFYIPDGYILNETKNDNFGSVSIYSGKGGVISIQVIPKTSLDIVKSRMLSDGYIGHDEVIGSYSGIAYSDSLLGSFAFERNGDVNMVIVDSSSNLNISKIIG